MTVCTICRTPLQDTEAGREACRACAYEIRAGLREIVLQLPLLEACRESDRGPAVRGGHRATAPLPGRADVLDLVGPGAGGSVEDPDGDQGGSMPIMAWLGSWAAFVAQSHPAVARDEYGQAVVGRCLVAVTRSTGGIPGWSRWLQMYVPFIASQGYAAELHTELQELLRRIRAITCTEPRRMLKYAPCPGCRAFALIETDGEWYIACQLCPRRLTRDEYRDHAESVLPGLANFALWMLVSGRAADSEADSIQPGVEVQPPVGYGGGDGNEILARPCAG